MKLNNKGWGTMEMLLLSGGLLIALLVAVFFISKLYGSLEGSVGNKYYMDLVASLESSARSYINEKDISVNGEYKISYETLKDAGYIENLEDIDGNKCNGYVIINRENNINKYNGYISCKNYKSPNY